MTRLLPVFLAVFLLGFAAFGQRAPAYEDVGETRTALQQALAERDAAEQRSTRLEAEAEATESAAMRTARGWG
jgi:murein hydrolase activator